MHAENSGKPNEPDVVSVLRELSRQAQAGDTNALPRIRAILDGHPEVWQYVGDLAALVERTWTEVLSAGDPLAAESLRRSVAELKADLYGEQPPALERLLADQVVAGWMEVKYLECLAAEPGGGSLAQASYRLKRRESADKRYRAALKMLADVRALEPARQSPATPARLYKEPRPQTA